MRSLIVLAAAIIVAPVAAQAPAEKALPTIDPGMTRAQVVAKLGEPLSVRTYDGHTYLLYKNGCEKKCGMNDLVVLDSGKVVDAVFRSRAPLQWNEQLAANDFRRRREAWRGRADEGS